MREQDKALLPKEYVPDRVEESMITCKLCNTRLEKKHLRRDGSMLCPECGQVYWKAAVEKARREYIDTDGLKDQIEARYNRESKRSTDYIARRVRIA